MMYLSALKHSLKSRPIVMMAVLLVVSCVLFLTINVAGNWEFVLALRSKKLLALLTVGFAIGTSTLLFQTLIQNPILTPSLLGFDALYMLIKSLSVVLFGAVGMASLPIYGRFFFEVAIMVGMSLLMFRLLFTKAVQDLTRLVLVGVIFGVLFRSFSSLVARMISPEDFVVVQAASFAQFNTVNLDLLRISLVIFALCGVVMWRLRYPCDILMLGRLYAINLGVDYHKVSLILLSVIAILVSVSTALVGPVSFFGLLVCAITNQITTSMHHSKRLVLVALTSGVCLIGGQVVFEHVLSMAGVLAVVIELLGGLAFLVLLFINYKKVGTA